jgi:hypothetical protein
VLTWTALVVTDVALVWVDAARTVRGGAAAGFDCGFAFGFSLDELRVDIVWLPWAFNAESSATRA